MSNATSSYKCPYLKKNKHCILRDDICKPTSFKCIENRKSFINFSVATPSTYKNETYSSNHRFTSQYDPYREERYGINKDVLILDKSNTVPALNVFKGFLNLSKKNTIDYKMTVKDIKTGRKYNILVAFNTQTQKYYISDVQLKFLHKQRLYPNAIITTCNDGSIPLSTLEFQEFSKLSLYGYSVGKNGLTSNDRKEILKHILDNKIMKAYEIVEHLQGLIHFREERTDKDFSKAINDWKEDIYYVNDYYNSF